MRLLEKTPWWRALAFCTTLGAPLTALADEVQVTLAEDPGGVTVRIRGVDAGALADNIVTSKTGALLFVPGDGATAQRLRPLERHRLDFVQIGRAGDRVAVRVVQRKKATGSLSKHMRTTAVAGGFDVRIEDSTAKPQAIAAAPVQPAPTMPFDRQAALAKFAPEAAQSPEAAQPPAPLPVADKAPRPSTRPTAPAVEAPHEAAPTIAAAQPANEPPTRPASKPVIEESPATNEDEARQAGTTADVAGLDLGHRTPQIGMAWLATAMLAFSGLGMLWWRKRRPALEAAAPLRVLARVAIGPKQQIVWIHANGRSLLVGATEQRIDLLADLAAEPNAANAAVPATTAAPSVPATTSATTSESSGRVAAFKQRLRAALGDELAGRNEEPALPPHLEMLAGDPRWVGRKESA